MALGVILKATQLHFRMKAMGEKINMMAPGGGSSIGVLRSLNDAGPATVPRLAAMRPVSRQHIQTIVNHLLAGGLVRYQPNPRHRKSQLVAITRKGEDVFNAMIEQALDLTERLAGGLEMADLKRADAVLDGLNAATLDQA